MSTRKILTLASMIAMLFAPVAFSAEPQTDIHVVGEKLDSGLGDLSASYAATEYQRVATANSAPDYMATEFVWMPMQSQTTGYHVAGEKLDSGLGDLSPSSAAPET